MALTRSSNMSKRSSAHIYTGQRHRHSCQGSERFLISNWGTCSSWKLEGERSSKWWVSCPINSVHPCAPSWPSGMLSHSQLCCKQCFHRMIKEVIVCSCTRQLYKETHCFRGAGRKQWMYESERASLRSPCVCLQGMYSALSWELPMEGKDCVSYKYM